MKDLDIYGDDAVDFLEAFSRKFHANLSNLNFEDYFDSERDRILPAIIRTLFRVKGSNKKKLTLGDLEDAALCGRFKVSSTRLDPPSEQGMRDADFTA